MVTWIDTLHGIDFLEDDEGSKNARERTSAVPKANVFTRPAGRLLLDERARLAEDALQASDRLHSPWPIMPEACVREESDGFIVHHSPGTALSRSETVFRQHPLF